MDLTAIRELRSIRETENQIYIGALTTWTDIVKAKLPEAFDGLRKASKTIEGVQTQNAGTICGNICNASPAADSVPNLKEVIVYDKGCSTYGLPKDVAEEIGLPPSASHPQDITHYMGLYFMASRGAQLVDRAIV